MSQFSPNSIISNDENDRHYQNINDLNNMLITKVHLPNDVKHLFNFHIRINVILLFHIILVSSNLQQTSLVKDLNDGNKRKSLNQQPSDQRRGHQTIISGPLIKQEASIKDSRVIFSSQTENIRKIRNQKRLTQAFNRYHEIQKIIKRFIDLLRFSVPFKKFYDLSEKKQLLICDHGCQRIPFVTYSNSQNPRNFKSLTSRYSSKKHLTLAKRICTYVINPQSIWLCIWQLFKLSILIFLIFQVTIQICFYLPVTQLIFGSIKIYIIILIQDQNTIAAIQFFIFFFFIIDIFISLKTGFYDEGQLVLNYKKSLENYIRFRLTLDLITIIPLIANFFITCTKQEDESIFMRFLNCLIFIKIFSFTGIFSILEGRIQFSTFFQTIYRFLSVLGLVFIYAHIIGCLWHVIGSQGQNNNWIDFKQLTDQDWQTHYIYSIYWSVTTMSTVGYGDITAQNENEALFSVFTMLFSSILFAYCINTIGIIINEISLNNRQIEENLSIINRFMNKKNLNSDLQQRVRKYLQNIWTEQSKLKNENEQRLIKQLDNRLQEEIQDHIYGKLLSQIPVFNNYFSNELLTELTKYFDEHIVSSKTQIIETGQKSDHGLYFLLQGEADITIEMKHLKYSVGKFQVFHYQICNFQERRYFWNPIFIYDGIIFLWSQIQKGLLFCIFIKGKISLSYQNISKRLCKIIFYLILQGIISNDLRQNQFKSRLCKFRYYMLRLWIQVS